MDEDAVTYRSIPALRVPVLHVVTDVRLLAEAVVLDRRGFKLVMVTASSEKRAERLEALGLELERENHSTETALGAFPPGTWDYTVNNDGTLEDLRDQARSIVKRSLDE